MKRNLFEEGEIVIAPSGNYAEVYRKIWNGFEWRYDLLIGDRLHRNKDECELIAPDINQRMFKK